jgi:hypothetical protein
VEVDLDRLRVGIGALAGEKEVLASLEPVSERIEEGAVGFEELWLEGVKLASKRTL